jgi:hypothetical protein
MKRVSIVLTILVILLTMGFRDDHGSAVIHDDTLKGDGTGVALGIAIPLHILTPPSLHENAFGITTSSNAMAILGSSQGMAAIFGTADNGSGIMGTSANKYGVTGNSKNGFGVQGIGGNVGVYAENNATGGTHTKAYLGSNCCAGDFYGNVYIHGKLDVEGTKHFMIDDPIDPSNKYLYHASVESPDMKNIYDGVLLLDKKGEGMVTMPEWFDALNNNFRYQLTAMGKPMPGLFVAQEISNNSFKISGGKAGGKVSWMVTGIRQDAWAKANPLTVEQNKPGNEKGTYLHPELFGASADKSVEKARYHKKG